MISQDQVKMLEAYRDKAFITSLLCQESMEFYSFLRSMINIPLILSSSVMSIINAMSDVETNSIKYTNIILNASTATILSLIGNFKLSEKVENFKSIYLKMNKLTHQLEDRLTNDIENTTADHIRAFISDYDNLNESLGYPFVGFIKTRIRKRYENKKTLPNVLNCQLSFIITEPQSPLP